MKSPCKRKRSGEKVKSGPNKGKYHCYKNKSTEQAAVTRRSKSKSPPSKPLPSLEKRRSLPREDKLMTEYVPSPKKRTKSPIVVQWEEPNTFFGTLKQFNKNSKRSDEEIVKLAKKQIIINKKDALKRAHYAKSYKRKIAEMEEEKEDVIESEAGILKQTLKYMGVLNTKKYKINRIKFIRRLFTKDVFRDKFYFALIELNYSKEESDQLVIEIRSILQGNEWDNFVHIFQTEEGRCSKKYSYIYGYYFTDRSVKYFCQHLTDTYETKNMLLHIFMTAFSNSGIWADKVARIIYDYGFNRYTMIALLGIHMFSDSLMTVVTELGIQVGYGSELFYSTLDYFASFVKLSSLASATENMSDETVNSAFAAASSGTIPSLLNMVYNLPRAIFDLATPKGINPEIVREYINAKSDLFTNDMLNTFTGMIKAYTSPFMTFVLGNSTQIMGYLIICTALYVIVTRIKSQFDTIEWSTGYKVTLKYDDGDDDE